MLSLFLLVAALVIEEGLGDRHCLDSDVLCTTADYQIRRYKESVWVGTHVDASISRRIDTFMYILIEYTAWGNSAGYLIHSNGQFLLSFTRDGNITIYLMLPEEHSENPPTPTNPQAFITRFPTMDVFVRRIRRMVLIQANNFNLTLTEQKANFNNSYFFVPFCNGGEEGAFSESQEAFGYRNLFWGRQVSIGGVSYDFSTKQSGEEVWFVATGRADCPRM
ncbi:uncharacterized protein LOC134342187 [Mobula hypostoma]|uniref:uncharacterized protein LOC134342187 n=1 Tax=Mobula hypostoma TaxID=723540 RepID=UPI002FC2D489